MTIQELKNKIAEIEWEDFEVKQARSEIPKSIWETVSAFANTNGGWIILGITQEGKIFNVTGVENIEKLEQDFLNTIRGQKFNAIIDTQQQIFRLENKRILGFYIKPSNRKPVYFNNQSNTFIRRGSSDQRATKEEIDSMYRDQSFGTKSSEKALGTGRESIHDSSLRQYRDYMSRFNPDVSYNRFEQDEFLNKLRIIEDGNCTYAGLLMLGKREIIEKFFPDFRIDLLEIPGTSYTDAKLRYTFRLDEFENLWEYYFQCFSRLKNHVDVKFLVSAYGFGQELSEGLVAIREALVNLLMHTDYFSPAKPRIRIFDNSIDFFNPGGLPKSIEELKRKDISLPRNPILAKLFRMVKLSENVGFGFDKIESNWKRYNHTIPEYEFDFDSVLVKFYLSDKLNDKLNDKLSDKLNTGQQQVFDLISKHPGSQTNAIEKMLKMPYGTIIRHINSLLKKKLIERRGSKKTGGYFIIQN